MAVRRRSLPQLVIAVPCRVDWSSMTRIDGDGRTRFCDSCERPVYDSASMTREELGDLIALHEGRRLPCVRLHRRPDGTIVTKSCFAPVLRAGRFLWLKVGLAAVAFWSTVFAFWSWARRPAASVIESAEVAEAAPRKSPFVLMPAAEPGAPRRHRISRKSRAKPAPHVETAMLGEMALDP